MLLPGRLGVAGLEEGVDEARVGLGAAPLHVALVDSRLFFVATKSDSAKLTGMKNPLI